MAITWKLGYTNDGVRSETTNLTNVDLHVASGYSLLQDEPGECQVKNDSSPIDQPELITFQCSDIKKIPTKVKVANPSQDPSGVMYGVRLDEVLRGTSDSDDAFCVDLPIVVNLSIKHPMNSAITDGVVKEVVSRTVSSLFKNDGTMRINSMMRGSLRPTQD